MEAHEIVRFTVIARTLAEKALDSTCPYELNDCRQNFNAFAEMACNVINKKYRNKIAKKRKQNKEMFTPEHTEYLNYHIGKFDGCIEGMAEAMEARNKVVTAEYSNKWQNEEIPF